MVKPVAKAEINSFIKGIISEASPLNFPPDASKDEENFDLNKDGSRNRRFGVDLESQYVLQSTGHSASEISNVGTSTFKWLNAGNDPEAEFVVVQFGPRLDVFKSNGDSTLSGGFIGSVTLTNVLKSTVASYAAIDGKLVVAAGTNEIHIIEYKNASLQYSYGTLKVRDLWGLADLDGNDVNIRPTALTDSHLYNLRNQGWGIPRKDAAGNLGDPIKIFYDGVTVTSATTTSSGIIGRTLVETFRLAISSSMAGNNCFPSNTESVYTGLQFQAGATPYERIYPNLYNETLGLNEPSAKGYFIIDALKRGISRAAEESNNRVKNPSLFYAATNFKADTTEGGCTLACDFSGRVFYAGFGGEVIDPEENAPNLTNYVLFSQVIKSKEDLLKCYQQGDPTSREGSDIVDTDGGFIRISGAKKIVALKVLANSIYVIADNGVWRIVGGNDYGFTASNYRVDKISSFGGLSEKTVVEVNDSFYFWGEEGIFQVARNNLGDYVCSNISQASIQSLYDEISISERKAAIGVYDLASKKVRWMYSNGGVVREYILDVILGAFTRSRIYNLVSNSPKVIGYVLTPLASKATTTTNILNVGNQVVTGSTTVVLSDVVDLPHTTSVKFLTLYSTVGGFEGYTFSQYTNAKFRDWKSVDGVGVDAFAYIITGTTTAGDSSVYKQVPYLIMHFLRTEDGVELMNGELVPEDQSSCMIRSQWNWSNSAASGNWGNLFQAYRYRKPIFITDIEDPYDSGFETVVTKNKLRGRGRALSLYMETEPNKNCILLGWNLSLTGNSLP